MIETKGLVLPAAKPGERIIVVNKGDDPLIIYPSLETEKAIKEAIAAERDACAEIARRYEKVAELNTAAEQQACAGNIRKAIEARNLTNA